MRYPTVFVNHGGGPMPLLGRQPDLVKHMKEVRTKFLPPEKPKAIVVLSAHWESDPIKITSSSHPKMLFDYSGFPPESYTYNYPAPGSPDLASKIKNALDASGISCELDPKRGYDHGVFIPLMIMFPEADVPVVSVSLHSSLSAERNMQVGKALAPLRDEGILILGSGYTFHNLPLFFNPSSASYEKSSEFNDWLKDTILHNSGDALLDRLGQWESAPGARVAHPREEHLMPLLMTAAAAGSNSTTPQIIYDVPAGNGEHAISGYLFQ
jgi:aromatic ring-opening dioxygenase catalytic subunit (LigB family)